MYEQLQTTRTKLLAPLLGIMAVLVLSAGAVVTVALVPEFAQSPSREDRQQHTAPGVRAESPEASEAGYPEPRVDKNGSPIAGDGQAV